jgi:serine/threonine protein kinase
VALAPGVRLGPYEVIALIGAGGMGEVYRARDTRLDRTVALKVLPAGLAADAQFRERFDREARAISKLDHQNICSLFDTGRHDGTSYLVMQFLEGETLADRLARGPLPLDQTLSIAIQIADALAMAHRAGIIHRDLKPGNVILTKTGAKLLDFGLAKGVASMIAGAGASALPTTPPALTVQGTILGTFQYMAPEQLEGREADARSDIFAFGAVIYEMITGRKAFEGTSHASLISAILKDEPARITSLQPLTPPTLERLVSTCLAKEPDDRWQTARDIVRELRWIAEGRAAQPLAVTPGRSRRERQALLYVSALVILAAFAGFLWMQRRSTSMPQVVRFDVNTPPSSDPSSFALSVDGRQLAFVAMADGATKLWVRPFDDTMARPLAGTDGASYPFWSPDGHALGFFADGKLKRIDLSGGAARILANAPSARGGTWNGDGLILFTPTATASDPTAVLMRVSSSGGTPEPVTHLSAGHGSHRWPQFLPDGRRFVFVSALGRPDANGVYLGSLDGREPIKVLASESAALFAPPNLLLAVRQGVLRAIPFNLDRGAITGDEVPIADAVGTDGTIARSAFSVSETGVLAHRPESGQRRQLVWFDRAGRRLAAVGEPDETSMAGPAIDPAGRRVAVYRAIGGNLDVWVMDLNREGATRLTFDSGVDAEPVWSADGQRVLFRSTRNGTADLFEKPATGAGEERVLLRDAGVPLSASPDGQFLLYLRTSPKTGSDIWAFPLTSGAKPFPLVQTAADEFGCEFSPDGRWIAYESNESGRLQIYVRHFPPSGDPWQISTSGGTQPRWRHDGKELYYVAPDAQLMAVPMTVSADNRTMNPGVPLRLFSTRLATGSNVIPGRQQYAVAPDGRFLMNIKADDTPVAPITVVMNWPAQIKP